MNGNGNGSANSTGRASPVPPFPLPPRASSSQHLDTNSSQNGNGPRSEQGHNRSSALYTDNDPEFLTSGLRLNILVAEDNLLSQKMLEKRIGMRGHELVVTGDGQECHDRFAASGGKVDVIIMDLKVRSHFSGPLVLVSLLKILIQNRCQMSMARSQHA